VTGGSKNRAFLAMKRRENTVNPVIKVPVRSIDRYQTGPYPVSLSLCWSPLTTTLLLDGPCYRHKLPTEQGFPLSVLLRRKNLRSQCVGGFSGVTVSEKPDLALP
jgi:hypothetical protein